MVGTSVLTSGGSYYTAKRTIPHENFSQLELEDPESGSVQYENDIGLIQTATPIAFNKKVLPIEFSNKEVAVGDENLQQTAWGVNEKGRRSDNLQVLNVTSRSTADCKRYSAADTPVNSTLCTLTPPNQLIYVRST